MAPVIPKRKSKPSSAIAARKPSIPTISSSNNAATNQSGPFEDTFRTTKKDKRQIKHSVLLSKIQKSTQKTLKRRRPSKKLVANLDSLVDALPDADDDQGQHGNNNDSQGISEQVNVIKQKSLKHKPGAMKRKEKLDQRERERFARNLAQMAGTQAASAPAESGVQAEAQTQPQGTSTSNRWAALRGFISQTMEQNPEFKTRGT
ncbi:hypothetical protein AJ79_06683 [Helicocarpus griseus UAMH5409]|uniref:Ribosome biogenesis protein SLX9 n=1 Tax=Helicocarpus griseus UAMH5409 TaxID=1447875 RepID=A0A2B7XAP8_9EURO|nr:hypothetical protein AJ79_06683 [Helicocarpus griseus UAMH5409]